MSFSTTYFRHGIRGKVSFRIFSISPCRFLGVSTALKTDKVDKYGNLYQVPEYPFPNLKKNVPRPQETPSQLRSRLIYQCRKRGILEAELLLSTFSREHLDELSDQDCKDLDRLLDENDWDIYYWATEEREPPTDIENLNVFQKLKEHTKNKGKKILRMPDLKE